MEKGIKKVTPLSTDKLGIADMLTLVMTYFFGICITTNICEGTFSILTSIFRFRGKRSVKIWEKILEIWFYQKYDLKNYHEFIHQGKIRSILGQRNGLKKVDFTKIDNPIVKILATSICT